MVRERWLRERGGEERDRERLGEREKTETYSADKRP